jgi:hypothetical protein
MLENDHFGQKLALDLGQNLSESTEAGCGQSVSLSMPAKEYAHAIPRLRLSGPKRKPPGHLRQPGGASSADACLGYGIRSGMMMAVSVLVLSTMGESSSFPST